MAMSRLQDCCASMLQEWMEAGYWRSAQAPTAERIPVNAFWADYARFMVREAQAGPTTAAGTSVDSGAASFLSEHLTLAASSFTEVVAALAVMGLPLQAPREGGDHATK